VTALKHYPDYPNALILKAELEKKDFEKSIATKNIKDLTKLSGEPELSQKFKDLEESYFKVHQIGYRRMPKEMYLNWLYRINKDTTRKPFYFKSPQPFKDYNYNVQIVTAGDGQNYEFYDQEDVVRIGTVQINRRTGKLVKFIEYGDDEIPDDVISRMYDPALGRFWQIDPLADQYFPASPYNYTLNNPVNIIDPDGRSAEAVIDEKNKTIKVNIVVVFYGSGASQENVDAAIATINKMYNANADEDGWSDGGDGWKIQVNATGEITDEEGAKEMAEDNEGNALYSYVRVEDQNNQTSVGGDNKISKMEEHAGNSGFWISRDMKTTTPAHEQGHGLGLSNPWHDLAEGIMVPGTNNRKVTQGNLSEMRSNILEHGTDKSSLIDKYLFNVKRLNYGSTNTTIYDKDGFSKN
jgi:RHS repeat-associated protein